MHGSTGIPIPVTTLGGLVTLANPETAPEGASPRLYDMDFNVGNVFTRAGLSDAYVTVDETVGPNPPNLAISPTWQNPGNIVAQDGQYTTQTPVGDGIHPLFEGGLGTPTVANRLDVTQFTFDIPGTSGISGLELIVRGYANAPVGLTATLLIAG